MGKAKKSEELKIEFFPSKNYPTLLRQKQKEETKILQTDEILIKSFLKFLSAPIIINYKLFIIRKISKTKKSEDLQIEFMLSKNYYNCVKCIFFQKYKILQLIFSFKISQETQRQKQENICENVPRVF
jgi:hypothetical protein